MDSATYGGRSTKRRINVKIKIKRYQASYKTKKWLNCCTRMIKFPQEGTFKEIVMLTYKIESYIKSTGVVDWLTNDFTNDKSPIEDNNKD